MKLGIIADVIIAVFIIVCIAVATKRGFIRSILFYTSTFIALAVAILSANPISKMLDSNFGWVAIMDTWKVPFLQGKTLLWIFVAVAVFVIARLILMLLDKVLKAVKEKMKVVNVLDRIFGSLFGLVYAMTIITVLFMLFDALNWEKVLQLTAEGGSYFAQHLFNFCKEYLFNVITTIFNAVTSFLPKI